MTETGQAAAASTGDQFYVTHCLTADSAMNSPGYSVRAASAIGNADALRLALEYPPYELPIDLWREKPTKAMAPRRLARTPHRREGIWAVHSVYLEKDTMNRDRSYFSHLIQLPDSTDAASVLRSWDAPGWIKEYPPKADKVLSHASLPVGTAISDQALAEFLSGPQSGPTDVSVVVCPVRLRRDPAARRELVLRFLQGLLLARGAGEDRDRLFVHAEPGLVAMLLYAAARILPSPWVADLSFSTFEPAHRGLKDYRLATVIGTYLGGVGKGLDPELVGMRGYGLDTLRQGCSSREFSEALPVGLSELLDLAAAGEWELLVEVHRLIGVGSDALGRVCKAVPLARALARLNASEASIEDLLILRSDARSSGILAGAIDDVWPKLKSAAPSDGRVRVAFKDWLAEPVRLDEFRRDAAKSLLKGDLAGWDSRWGVVREVAELKPAQAQLEKAINNLDEHLPNLASPVRGRLRAACADLGTFPSHQLLAPNGLEELSVLLDSETPAEWQAYTCFAVLTPDEKSGLLSSTAPVRTEMRERVRSHLLSASKDALTCYVKRVKSHADNDPVFLYSLLQPHSGASVAFLDRLIDVGASILSAQFWSKLLSDLNVYNGPEWQDFLFQSDHLAKLLAGFRTDPAATPIWGNYLELLSAELFEGDEWERTLYEQLRKARQALGTSGISLRSVLSAEGLAKWRAIETVAKVLSEYTAAARLEPGELLAAFQQFWPNDALAGLRLLYRKGKFEECDLSRDPRRLDPFIAAFLSCYPMSREFYSARSAVAQWLALSGSCSMESRAAFQTHFVRNYVPREWHESLLEERGGIALLPEAEARIRESTPSPLTMPEQRDFAAANRPGSSEAEQAQFASASTQRALKVKARGRGAARRWRAAGMSSGVIAVIAVGVIALLVLGLAVFVKFRGRETKATELDTSPMLKSSSGTGKRRTIATIVNPRPIETEPFPCRG